MNVLISSMFGVMGCADPSAPTGADVAVGDPAAAEVTPLWTAGDVGAEIEAAVALGVPVAEPLFDAFDHFLGAGDGACPPSPQGISYPDGGACTSRSGVTFQGVGMRIEIDETVGDTRNTLRTVEPASFRFTDVDGVVYAAGGAFRNFTTTTPSTYTWRTELEGVFQYPPAGGWLGAGISGALTWAGQDAGGTREVVMSGGLSVIDHVIFFHKIH